MNAINDDDDDDDDDDVTSSWLRFVDMWRRCIVNGF